MHDPPHHRANGGAATGDGDPRARYVLRAAHADNQQINEVKWAVRRAASPGGPARRPSYVSLGNHDATVQGNLHALQALDDLAKGCVKPLALSGLAGRGMLATSPGRSVLVPPDPERGFADQPTYRGLHATGRQLDAHGFGFVDERELAASRGQASYHAFTPRRGLRMISINTVAEGDRLNSDGNLDEPQFQWLRRSSRPLRLGADLQELALAHPDVLAYVAGHTHENRISAIRRHGARAGGFWAIETAAEVDWPIQSRLLELMDNRDGTLSIFGTLIDHAATLATPRSGTPAASFGLAALAALGREFAYNDPQAGVESGTEGRPQDRNVERLLPDPRRR